MNSRDIALEMGRIPFVEYGNSIVSDSFNME